MNDTLLIFDGMNLLARGTTTAVTGKVRELLARHPQTALLAFEEGTGRQTELELRPVTAQPKAEVKAVEPTGPGRPKLGVVGREVTLLPRHWEWLGSQPGGSSIALRKLVESAMKANRAADAARQRQEGAYRFMSAMAGDLPGYEEAIRALFAGDEEALKARMKAWPKDVRAFALELAFGKRGELTPED